MTDTARIYVDFLNADGDGRLILSCYGTSRDLARHNIELEEGLKLTFYSDDADDAGNPDDLVVQGIVQYDKLSGQWVAVIDWDAIRHASDYRGPYIE
jgi:hypothetical protein